MREKEKRLSIFGLPACVAKSFFLVDGLLSLRDNFYQMERQPKLHRIVVHTTVAQGVKEVLTPCGRVQNPRVSATPREHLFGCAVVYLLHPPHDEAKPVCPIRKVLNKRR